MHVFSIVNGNLSAFVMALYIRGNAALCNNKLSQKLMLMFCRLLFLIVELREFMVIFTTQGILINKLTQ